MLDLATRSAVAGLLELADRYVSASDCTSAATQQPCTGTVAGEQLWDTLSHSGLTTPHHLP